MEWTGMEWNGSDPDGGHRGVVEVGDQPVEARVGAGRWRAMAAPAAPVAPNGAGGAAGILAPGRPDGGGGHGTGGVGGGCRMNGLRAATPRRRGGGREWRPGMVGEGGVEWNQDWGMVVVGNDQ